MVKHGNIGRGHTVAPRSASFSVAVLMAVWAGLAAAPGVGRAEARPAQIILLRHAEKPDNAANPHLSEPGRKRAEALAGFFTKTPALTNYGQPAALFATRATNRGHSGRPRETLEPLARQLKQNIQTPYFAEDYASLARHLLQSSKYDGQTVVVCWVHDSLPELAAALGVKSPPSHWKGTVYDRVWIITWRGNKAILKELPQRLLPGDSRA
jgi:hypothetical protein